MARSFSSGFELGDLAKEGFTATSGSLSSSITNGGTYSYRNNPSASVSNITHSIPNSSGTFYMRFYLYISSYPASGSLIFSPTTSGTPLIRIRGTGSGIRATDAADVQIGSDVPLSTATWYRVEIRVTISSTIGSIDVLVDGTTVITATGRNTGASVANSIQVGSSATLSHDYYIDDIAINDTTGTSQISYPGAGKIIHVYPSGDNTSNWTPSTGTTHFNLINDVPPDDSTSFVSAVGSTTTVDYYSITMPSAVGSSDVINLVAVNFRYGLTTTGAGNSLISILSSGGNAVGGSSTQSTTTVYSTLSPNLISYSQPVTATPYTKSILNSSFIGLQISNLGNLQATAVTSEWLLVDYAPVSVSVPFVTPIISQPSAHFRPIIGSY